MWQDARHRRRAHAEPRRPEHERTGIHTAADFSEWQTGRRFTGMVFATIGFSLKAGLAMGSAAFLWLMEGVWNYDTRSPGAPDAIAGYQFSGSISVGLLFLGCVLCVALCGLNRTVTRRMGMELAARRSAAAT